ncbi:hypothetical protein [Klebsiella pneumoniae]|uniref:hypothetical protein n=1 Tax=Klebsiella pneumoniae TaxID=573 RepID=UPI00388D4D68
MRKQDIIFVILKHLFRRIGRNIFGDGVRWGYCRMVDSSIADSSYLAGPDDIYVSPAKSAVSTSAPGDTISGKIRPPKEGERYFALLKVSEVNYDKPEKRVTRSCSRT